jgi:hypothetical protein
MTESQPDPTPLEETDDLIESTGNGLQPDDPVEQPPQDPDHLPDGTETGGGE